MRMKIVLFISSLLLVAASVHSQPVITNMTPSVATPGTTVTISGTGFNTTLANNIIYFGATKATVSTATATTLSVVVPTGSTAGFVTALNTSTTLTGYSPKVFQPTFDTSQFVTSVLNFNTAVNFNTGVAPTYVAIWDIDGNGKPDLISVNSTSNTISVFRNTSSSGSISASSFAAKVDFATGTGPNHVAIGDLNGDGKPELVVTNNGTNTISIFNNLSTSGTISLSAKVDITVGNNPYSVAIGDIDGNGKPDLAVVNKSDFTISLLGNVFTTGSITTSSFGAVQNYSTTNFPESVKLADLDGDGKPEMINTNAGGGASTITIRRNVAVSGTISTSSFAVGTSYAANTQPRNLAVGDFDGDGKTDIATVTYSANTVGIFRNTSTLGSPSVGTRVDLTAGNGSVSIAAGDLNGDGKPELIVCNQGANTLFVYRNQATSGSITTSSFAAPITIATGIAPGCAAIGDLDGDKRADILFENIHDDNVSVIRNDQLGQIAGVGVMCIGSKRTLTNSVAGGTWSSSATGVATVSSTGVVTGVFLGTAIITYTVANGYDTAQVAVNFNEPTLLGAIASTTSLCEGAAITLTSGYTTGTGSIISYNWSGPNGYSVTGTSYTVSLPSVTAAASGNYSLSVTYPNGCITHIESTPYITVGVRPTVASITASATSLCNGDTLKLTAGSTTGSGTATSYNWTGPGSYSAASAAAFITFTPTTVFGGAYSVSVTYSNGCTSTQSASAIVSPMVATGIIWSGGPVCAGTSITLNSFSFTPGDSWIVSNPLVAAISIGTDSKVRLTAISPGTVTVTHATPYSCYTPAAATITVAGVGLSYSSGGLTGPVCAGGTLTLNSGTATVSSYSWAGPNGYTSTQRSPTISAANTLASGLYTFTATVGACTASKNLLRVHVDTLQTGLAVLPATLPLPCPAHYDTISAVGYSYKINSIPYELYDFSTGGIQINSNDDDAVFVTLPFIFSMYGIKYSGAYVNTNGAITFGGEQSGLPCLENPLPNATFLGKSLIAFGNTDVIRGDGYNFSLRYKTFGTAPNRKFVIYYKDIVGYNSPPSYSRGYLSGQIVLHEDGNAIDMFITHCDPVSAYTDTSIYHPGYWTFGIQDTAGHYDIVPSLNHTNKPVVMCQGWRFATASFGAYSWSPSAGLSAADVHDPLAFYTGAARTHTITVTNPSSACPAVSATKVIGFPEVTNLGSDTICLGGSTTLMGRYSSSTYGWEGPNVSCNSCATTVVSPTVTSGYFLIGTLDSGCPGGYGASLITITVRIPTASALVADSNVCIGATTSLSAGTVTNSGPVSSYNWSGPAGYSRTTSTPYVLFTPTTTAASGVYSLSLTNTMGCTGPSVTATIIVNNLPSVSGIIASADSICLGSSVTLTAGTVTGTGTLTSYNWSGPGGYSSTSTLPNAVRTPTATAASGSYSLSVTYSGLGCTSAQVTTPVTVKALPVIIVSPSSVAVCNGLSTTATASGGTTYTWSPSSGLSVSTGAITNATPTVTTAYTVTGVFNNCQNKATTTITVNAVPVLSVTPATAAVCNGSSTSLTTSGASTYTWLPATGLNATTGATVTATPTVTTVYSVSGTNAAGCTGTTTKTVTVNAVPVLTVTPTSPAICKGASTSVTALGASTYSWSPATGISASTGAAVNFTRTVTTTYTVTGTNSSGCNATAITTVTVNPVPVLTITPVSSAICDGSATSLTSSGATTYSWLPGAELSVTTGSNVIASPTTTTVYTVTGTNTYGCNGIMTRTVTVNPTPVLTATPTLTDICKGTSTSITAGGATTYSWSPSTGLSASTGTAVNFTRTITTTYTVVGTTGSCKDTVVTSVTVNPVPVLTVTPASATICSGSSTSLTSTGADSYSWSPGTSLNTSTGTMVIAMPGTTTIYSVTGTNVYGCNSTTTRTVTVNSTPVLTVTPTLPVICRGLFTPVVAGGATTYTWSPSAGLSASTGTAVTFTRTITTTYTVVGTTGSCKDTTTVSIGVNPIPILAVSPSVAAVCIGSSTTLEALGADTYSWSPSVGLSSTTGNLVDFTRTVTSIYTITGTDTNGCIGTATKTVTINALPVLSVTPTSPRVCVGASTTMAVVGAVTYNWLPATGLSSSTGTAVTASPASSAIYTITGVGALGCVGVATSTVTVDTLPLINTAAGVSTLCTGLSTTIGVSGAATYSWLPNSGLSATTGAIVTASPTTSPVYTITGTDANGCAGIALQAINVVAAPSATIATAGIPCIGSSTNVLFSGTPGAAIAYKIDSGIAINDTLTGGLLSVPTGAVSSPHTYTLVNVSDAHCTIPLNLAVAINTILMQWTGGVTGHEHDWNNIGNWNCGSLPGITNDVSIPGSVIMPEIVAFACGSVHNITLAAGASITLGAGALLNVAGIFDNNGTIRGDGIIILNGSTAQTVKGRGEANTIQLSNASGVTIDSGSRLTIARELTIASGTLNTNDSLVLASDINGSARIAEIPAIGAAIVGKVKVQQYIQANYRRYRFWAHPFSTALSLIQLQPYMDITGTGGATNGFTTTGTNAPSAFRLDPYTSNSTLGYDPGWKPITKINGTEADSNKVQPHQGLRLFMRGAKGQGLGGFAYTPLENTLAMSGPVNQGNQTVVLYRGHGAIPTQQDYNMVGNPYPSPVDLGTAIYNASLTGNVVGAAFYVYNSGLGVAGQFQAVLIGAGAPVPYSIQANACFQVRAGFDSAEIHFTESMKTPAATTYLLKPSNKQYVSLNVYDENYHPWDMLTIMFSDAATDGEDIKLDALKPSGADFNFYSLSTDNKKMVIDSRPFAPEKIIPLGVTSAYQQAFIIEADNLAIPENTTLYLHDKLLNKHIELRSGTEYKFTISKDKSTQGDNRFELGLTPVKTIEASTASNVTVFPNPATNRIIIKASIPVNVKLFTPDGKLVMSQFDAHKLAIDNLASGVYIIMVYDESGLLLKVERLVKMD